MENGNKDLLKWHCRREAKKLTQDWDTIFIFTGQPPVRVGKTTLALWAAKHFCNYAGLEYNVNEIMTYDGAQFIEKIEGNPEYSPVILDEAGDACNSREWYTDINKAISKALMVSGQYHKALMFCLPSLKLLDSTVKYRMSALFNCLAPKNVRGYCKVFTPNQTLFSRHNNPYFNPFYDFRFFDLPPRIKEIFQKTEREGKAYLMEKYIEQAGGKSPEALAKHIAGLPPTEKEQLKSSRVYSAALISQMPGVSHYKALKVVKLLN